jgi:MinD-like ATPase involved in chromosome partitioning or flagellar assembly
MKKVIVIHSFRRGAGKSSLVANLSALLSSQGLRVAAVDTDFQAPSLNLFFGLSDESTSHTLNDYLWERCEIAQAIYDVTPHLNIPAPGKLFLVPASTRASEILQILRQPYDFERLNSGVLSLFNLHTLDAVLVDTTAGLSEETLLSIALAARLVILLRPDPQDYQGTAVTVEVAQNLGVPSVTLLLNQTPEGLDEARSKAQLEQTFRCPVVGLLPYSNALSSLASREILSLHDPKAPLVALLKQLASKLVGD